MFVFCTDDFFRTFECHNDSTIGFTVDQTTEASLQLCISKAATESLTLAEYNAACEAILGEPSSSSHTTQQSSSAAVPVLECIHSIAVRNTIQKAGSSCEPTEDLFKIQMKVEKTSFTALAMSAAKLSPVELRTALAKASLSPPVVNVDGAGGAAGGAAAAVESTMWPFETEAQRQSSFVTHMIPQAWRVHFERRPGDPITLYSFVAPGTDFSTYGFATLFHLLHTVVLLHTFTHTEIHAHTRTYSTN